MQCTPGRLFMMVKVLRVRTVKPHGPLVSPTPLFARILQPQHDPSLNASETTDYFQLCLQFSGTLSDHVPVAKLASTQRSRLDRLYSIWKLPYRPKKRYIPDHPTQSDSDLLPCFPLGRRSRPDLTGNCGHWFILAYQKTRNTVLVTMSRSHRVMDWNGWNGAYQLRDSQRINM